MGIELSLKEVCEGLFDLLDGIYDKHEIHKSTGLPLERCLELLALKSKCYKYIFLTTLNAVQWCNIDSKHELLHNVILNYE